MQHIIVSINRDTNNAKKNSQSRLYLLMLPQPNLCCDAISLIALNPIFLRNARPVPILRFHADIVYVARNSVLLHTFIALFPSRWYCVTDI